LLEAYLSFFLKNRDIPVSSANVILYLFSTR